MPELKKIKLWRSLQLLLMLHSIDVSSASIKILSSPTVANNSIRTINFIFGFAPMVFQDCLILVKQSDQVNVLTADGDSQIPARGIIIHRSVIKAVPRGLPILLRMCESIHLDLENLSWSENNTYFIIQLLHMSTHIIL